MSEGRPGHPGRRQRAGRIASTVAIVAAAAVVAFGEIGIAAMGIPMVGLLALLPALAAIALGLTTGIGGYALHRDRLAALALISIVGTTTFVGAHAGLVLRAALADHEAFEAELRAERADVTAPRRSRSR